MYGDENQINRVDMFATGGYRPDNNLSRRCKNVTQQYGIRRVGSPAF